MVLITLIFLPRRHDHPRTEDAEKVLSNTERETGTGGRHQTKTWSAGHAQARHRANTTPHACRTRLLELLPHHGKEGNGEDGEQSASCSYINGWRGGWSVLEWEGKEEAGGDADRKVEGRHERVEGVAHKASHPPRRDCHCSCPRPCPPCRHACEHSINE